jgi:hypothetical protein
MMGSPLTRARDPAWAVAVAAERIAREHRRRIVRFMDALAA